MNGLIPTIDNRGLAHLLQIATKMQGGIPQQQTVEMGPGRGGGGYMSGMRGAKIIQQPANEGGRAPVLEGKQVGLNRGQFNRWQLMVRDFARNTLGLKSELRADNRLWIQERAAPYPDPKTGKPAEGEWAPYEPNPQQLWMQFSPVDPNTFQPRPWPFGDSLP